MFAEDKVTQDLDQIRTFLVAERAKTLSEAEWRFRMRGYGYKLRRVDEGIEVARLPQNKIVGTVVM